MQKITFHHVGIPTTEKLPPESYSEKHKMHATGYFETPYAIEKMNFDDDNDLPDIIKTQVHVAFVVEDIEAAIKGKEIVLEPNSPSEGVMVAFVKDGDDLLEFLQFDTPEQEVWPHPNKFVLE